MDDHAAGLWSTTPPRASAFRRVDHHDTQAVVDAQPSRVAAGAFDGPITVEGTSVTFERDGSPVGATVVGLTDDGRRVVAVTTDHATMREICTDGWDHHRAEVHTNGTTNTVEG